MEENKSTLNSFEEMSESLSKVIEEKVFPFDISFETLQQNLSDQVKEESVLFLSLNLSQIQYSFLPLVPRKLVSHFEIHKFESHRKSLDLISQHIGIPSFSYK